MLYFRLIGANIRSQLQYKASFILELIGFVVLSGIEFLGVAILVTRFGSIGGWSMREVTLLFGLGTLSFGIAHMVCRGFDSPFEVMIQRGTFDTLLIRPHSAFFQVLCSEFQLRQLGRLLEGAALLGWALLANPISWNAAKLLVLPVAVISGALVYVALIVVGATICFWTVRMPEIMHAFSGGGKELTSYPLGIYDGWIRGIFLFVIPIGFTSYPAALLVLDRSDPYGFPAAAAWFAPLMAALTMAAALAFWRAGVRKYASAGS